MSSCVKLTRFELRRNTFQGWLQSNPILLAGEPGVEVDTGQMKVGNGRDRWTSLVYVGTGLGGGSGTLNSALVKNIGLHAYIQDFVITNYTFNNVTRQLVYYITVLGNAIYLDMAFMYSPYLPINSIVFSSVNTLNYNNNLNSGQPNLSFVVPFTVGDAYVPGNYTVTIGVNSFNAGGSGDGSFSIKTLPITLNKADAMGDPIIVSCVPLGITGPTTTISGIKYFTTSTYVTIPTRGLAVYNIYNVVDNQNFNYITFGQSSSGSYAANSLVYSNGLGGYTNFPNKNNNVTYFNGSNITLNIVNSSPISVSLLNAIGKTSYQTFFPSSALGNWTGGNQTSIGYVNPTPDEAIVPLKSNTYGSITLQQRQSISSAENNPQTPNITSNVVAFNPSSLTTYDPAYNPFNGNFYASSISTTLSSYIMPTQTLSFNPGTKYLLIKLTTTGYLRQFIVDFNSTLTSGILGMWVYWTTATTNKWYDANVDFTQSGGNGCSSNSHGLYRWPITFNQDDLTFYTVPGGYIYLNIKFNGVININSLTVLA